MSATSVGAVSLDLIVDKGDFQRQMTGMAKPTAGITSAFKSMGLALGLTLGAAAVAGFVKSSISLASDLQEVQNVVDVVFGESAQEINNFSKGALKAFGLSELSAKRFTSTMGAMLKSSGLSANQAKNMSMAMTALSGDMASFYNLKPEEAFNKIRAGISGETEPLKQLGINMSVANMEAFALSKGITKSYQAMTQAEQSILRYNYLLNTTTDAQGDFARTSGSWANQVRILGETWRSVMATMGSAFMTILTPILKGLNWIIQKLAVAAQYFKAFVNMIFGVKEESASIAAPMESGGDAIGGLGDAVKGAAKKVKGSLAPFDQLNTISMGLADSAAAAAGGLGGGAIEPVSFGQIDTSGSILGLDELDKKMEILKGKFLTFADPLIRAFSTIYEVGIKPFKDLFLRVVRDTIDSAQRIWEKHGPDVVKSLNTAWKSIQGVFQSLWTVIIQPILENTLKNLTELWNNHLKGMVEQLGITWLALYELFQTLIGVVIMPLVKYLIDTFGPTFTTVFKWIQDRGFEMSGYVVDALTNVLKALGGLATFATGVLTGDWTKAMNGLKTVADSIMAGITKLFGNSINSIISMVNSLIRSLNKLKVKVPDWVPGIGGKEFGFNLSQLGYLDTSGYKTSAAAGAASATKNSKLATMMATGGVVKQPTLAMIGEGKYNEAVVPLGNSPQMKEMLGQFASMVGGGSSEPQGDVILKIGESEFARMAIRAINNYQRQTGVSLVKV